MSDLAKVIFDQEEATKERIKRNQEKYALSTKNQKASLVSRDNSEDSSQISNFATKS